MPSAAIKATYSLDAETMQTLERIARRWNVSKSEALRRAIRAVATTRVAPAADALAALDELQTSFAARAVDLGAWQRRVRRERRKWTADRSKKRVT